MSQETAMAFSVKIEGIAKKKGKVLLNMEPPWWDESNLINDERFVKSNEGGYLDYDADVSLEEMREMHDRFRSAATRGVYACEEWQEIIQPMLREIEEALYIFGGLYSHFHINVFEWESGLD